MPARSMEHGRKCAIGVLLSWDHAAATQRYGRTALGAQRPEHAEILLAGRVRPEGFVLKTSLSCAAKVLMLLTALPEQSICAACNFEASTIS